MNVFTLDKEELKRAISEVQGSEELSRRFWVTPNEKRSGQLALDAGVRNWSEQNPLYLAVMCNGHNKSTLVADSDKVDFKIFQTNGDFVNSLKAGAADMTNQRALEKLKKDELVSLFVNSIKGVRVVDRSVLVKADAPQRPQERVGGDGQEGLPGFPDTEDGLVIWRWLKGKTKESVEPLLDACTDAQKAKIEDCLRGLREAREYTGTLMSLEEEQGRHLPLDMALQVVLEEYQEARKLLETGRKKRVEEDDEVPPQRKEKEASIAEVISGIALEDIDENYLYLFGRKGMFKNQAEMMFPPGVNAGLVRRYFNKREEALDYWVLPQSEARTKVLRRSLRDLMAITFEGKDKDPEIATQIRRAYRDDFEDSGTVSRVEQLAAKKAKERKKLAKALGGNAGSGTQTRGSGQGNGGRFGGSCFNCGKRGHKSADCRVPGRKRERSRSRERSRGRSRSRSRSRDRGGGRDYRRRGRY